MIKKIQQYLLTNHPLAWNTRIAPMLIISILVGTFAFLFGYWNIYVDFESYNNSNINDQMPIYFFFILFSILFLLFWITQYSKNNALNSFYPKKANTLYLEWIFSFIIVASIISPPFLFYFGTQTKVISILPHKDLIEGTKILRMTNILIPNYNYKSIYSSETPQNINYPSIKETLPPSSDNNSIVENSPIKGSTAENTQPTYWESHPDNSPYSLLNFRGNYHGPYINYDWNLDLPNHEKVKEWLISEDKEQIEKLMDSFLALIKKHNLTTNLTKDKWLSLVYNPDKYPVGKFNIILMDKDIKDITLYYLPYRSLSSAYSLILRTHFEKTNNFEIAILILLYISLGVTTLLISFRFTNGKEWIGAIILMGILMLANLFFCLLIGQYEILYISILVGYFIISFAYVITKRKKGKNGILINTIYWMIPAIPVIIIRLLLSYFDANHDCLTPHSFSDFVYNNSKLIMTSNLILTFFTIWLFSKYFLLRWKSLPED